MRDEALARRYATALLEVVGEAESQPVDEALARVAHQLLETEAARIWLNPVLGHEAKRALIAALVEEEPPVLARFLEVIIAHRREAEIATIAESFHRAVLEQKGLTEAVITSGRPLPQEEKVRAQEALSRYLGKRLAPRFEVDPALIGGVRVTWGDRMLDWSVAGALERLKSRLLATREEVKA